MPEDCSAYTCQTGTAPFVTSDDREHKAAHAWSLKLEYAGIALVDVSRAFNLSTKFDTTASADLYKVVDGETSPCNSTSSGSITGLLSESISGFACSILYANLKDDVYLIEKVEEAHTSSYTTQNPFHYVTPYGNIDSVAYFVNMTKTQTSSYQLWIKGVKVFDEIGNPVTTSYKPQPIVWPVPASTSAFFLGAAEYAWLNDTFFYWYNDPSDTGYAPCYTGLISGGGEGTLTGYSRALADGGKDFFYPAWVRENVFVGNELVHGVWAREASSRFENRLGGQISETCAAPFTQDYSVSLPLSSVIAGNAVITDEQQFYSFWLPKLKKAMTNMGTPEMTEAFLQKLEGANVCFPISVT